MMRFEPGDVVLYGITSSTGVVHRHDHTGVWVTAWNHGADWMYTARPQVLRMDVEPHPEADRLLAEYTAAVLTGEAVNYDDL